MNKKIRLVRDHLSESLESARLSGWRFIDDWGCFEITNPQRVSYLYFPLVNPLGMMSAITPTLNGDANLNQNTFLLLPVSAEDLHNTRSARNFWVRINDEPWSVTGNSAEQIRHKFSSLGESVELQAGFLWHEVKRKHQKSGLVASVINFVPSSEDAVELMCITLTNTGKETLQLLPTAAIPIYGRSADNLRDHRHVTTLLHRTECHPAGVVVKPTMSFDERGHKQNRVAYAVLGFDQDGQYPGGFTPLVEDFIGEGGCFTWPKAVVDHEGVKFKAGSKFEGYESIGALHFDSIRLSPGESCSYILVLSILGDDDNADGLVEKYGSAEKFEAALRATKLYWKTYLSNLTFDYGDDRRNGWLKWVTLQPKLRQIMGNSFLPYHDYGRGGRGWRDLWQDLLAILITSESRIDKLLLSNFAGVRFDGSNANIVGSSPGEFASDRNNIPRVWMDHGAWPLLTTKLYIDWTGDLDLLLENQTYFMDHLTHRCQRVNPDWSPGNCSSLKTTSGETVKGSVLEHLLVQHLTEFFNVGEHNLIRLEGGDWNDGFDMASERGESVAFSAMYAGNLRELSDLCLALFCSGVESAEIAIEISELLDQRIEPIDYGSITAKQQRLHAFFTRNQAGVSGEKMKLSLEEISHDLRAKADWLTNQIRKQEWVVDSSGRGWFNGYYDNQGSRVEGEGPDGVRMTLTGQVFPLMSGVATSNQAEEIIQSADEYLYAAGLNGYRLNTDFGEHPPELGRAFGFAYGHKENGAVFSHMAVMYAYGLYRQGFAEAAWRVLDGLYHQSQSFDVSKMYPGIPEYFNMRGRGMYPYLTGSAAWYMFTLLTETFGVKGKIGDLCLEPKLTKEQFTNSDQLQVSAAFAGKRINVTYRNSKRLGYREYSLRRVVINHEEWERSPSMGAVCIPKIVVDSWPENVDILIELDD